MIPDRTFKQRIELRRDAGTNLGIRFLLKADTNLPRFETVFTPYLIPSQRSGAGDEAGSISVPG
jgi:hypothetical protein